MITCLLTLLLHAPPALTYEVVSYQPAHQCPLLEVSIRGTPRQVTIAWKNRRFVCDLATVPTNTPVTFYYRLGHTRAWYAADEPLSCFSERRT